MRNAPNLKAERYRITVGPQARDITFGNNGMFEVPAGTVTLLVRVSEGCGWDHVSVSLPHRTPTWAEMETVRALFFRDDETVMQLSVPRDEHVNIHDHTLHLWRPQSDEEIARVVVTWNAFGEGWPWGDLKSPGVIPRPPKEMV